MWVFLKHIDIVRALCFFSCFVAERLHPKVHIDPEIALGSGEKVKIVSKSQVICLFSGRFSHSCFLYRLIVIFDDI